MPWPDTRRRRRPSRPRITGPRAAHEQKVSLILRRRQPALLAAGFGVSRSPSCAPSSFFLLNDGVFQKAALRIETTVAVAGKPEVVGAHKPRLVLGSAAGHGVDLPRIIPRRDGVDSLDPLLLDYGLLHHPGHLDREGLQVAR